MILDLQIDWMDEAPTLGDGVMETEGARVSLCSVHTGEPGRRVAGRGFVIVFAGELGPDELRRWSRRRDSGQCHRGAAAGLTATGWRSSANHLLLLQRNLGLDGQDEIWGGVPQLAHVLVDVVAHVVVHVAGGRRGDSKEVKDSPEYNTHTHQTDAATLLNAKVVTDTVTLR